MCTFSWTAAPDRSGYDLFFNRDERHARAVETPPSFGETGGLRWIAPRDPDAGGTWLLVNATGLTLALLNDYAASWRPTGLARSRGRLVHDLADARDLADIATRLGSVDLLHLPSFHLVAVTPDGAARHWHWDGVVFSLNRLGSPACLSSSSFATAEVVASRLENFAALRAAHAGCLSASVLNAWHRLHDPERPAHSVLMARSDAATRSLIHVKVRRNTATVVYESFYPVPSPVQVLTLPCFV